ncbi:MBL fold metallo-hydrolase [Chloroflexota bacterium]
MKKDLLTGKPAAGPYSIVKEKLNGNNTYLTGLFFHHGGNIYVFSYEKEETIKHMLIDTGDLFYKDQIFSILTENEVNPANIEGIIITHRHTDHSGLAAMLAEESGARIIVHSNFQSFIENDISPEERRWFGNFDAQRLNECEIEYLSESEGKEVISISGVDFMSLVEPIEIGEAGQLEILAVPETSSTHTPDQLVVLYSPGSSLPADGKGHNGLLSTTDILFSGDLWLMTGPNYNRGVRHISRRLKMISFRMRNLLAVRGMMKRNHREQDAESKEALKKGFSLIKVKPGHGDEFIGSRIIPNGLLSSRDTLVRLGYPEDANQSILRQKELAPRIAALNEEAYASFIRELHLWLETGYSPDEVSSLLVRIYKEQSGGGPKQVKKDRKERRKRLQEILARLKDDEAESGELKPIVESTLQAIKKVA